MVPQLLIAEDNENDIFLFERTLKKYAYKKPFQLVRDGTEAVRWLEKLEIDGSNSSANGLVLITDLKMPKMGGFELVKWIRSHAFFSATPVIIYSSSELPTDVSRARALGAVRYFQKNVAFSEVIRFSESITKFG